MKRGERGASGQARAARAYVREAEVEIAGHGGAARRGLPGTEDHRREGSGREGNGRGGAEGLGGGRREQERRVKEELAEELSEEAEQVLRESLTGMLQLPGGGGGGGGGAAAHI